MVEAEVWQQLVAAASSFRPGPPVARLHTIESVPSGEIGGDWRKRDSGGALLVILISSGCLLAIAAIVSASAALHWKGGPLGQHSDVVQNRPLWRKVALVLIGVSPLIVMLALGETFRNVLIAMLAMHWGCMLLLPVLYYVIRSHEDPVSRSAALTFYSQFVAEQREDCCRKLLRGFVLGIPLFLGPVLGYYCMRCETFDWFLCVRSFEKPLGAYGLKSYSMNFKLLIIGLYFACVNPIFEELFWRVFLHRELALQELGADLDHRNDEASALLADHSVGERHEEKEEVSPFAELCRPRVHLTFYSEVCRWLVCALYASYHIWPISIIFGALWWLYAVGGFCGLTILGRGFLLLRETPQFGLPATLVAHALVDAAFVVICFVKF